MLYVIVLAAVGLFGGFSQTGAQAKAFEDNYKNELAAIRYGLDAYDNIYSLLDEVEQQEVPRNGEVDLESSDGNIYGEIPDDHGRINELGNQTAENWIILILAATQKLIAMPSI